MSVHIRPYNRSDSDGWEWDGRTLKPYNRSDSDGWETDGDVPIPVLAFVLNIVHHR